ncbi:MAG: hypothetical protein A2X86_16080 [Bdellovibrionales bacterium GWA2_49_15]|nr:MAG: hypothetical protein A2X86_16080 [Bdellovibrionales bacterium GWA2_49_15]HAZ13203.1 hypothetical protein [Bdellovibrionales bacterium]
MNAFQSWAPYSKQVFHHATGLGRKNCPAGHFFLSRSPGHHPPLQPDPAFLAAFPSRDPRHGFRHACGPSLKNQRKTQGRVEDEFLLVAQCFSGAEEAELISTRNFGK